MILKISALCLSPRLAPPLSLAWTFAYLLFFRLVEWFGLPPPTPFANAIQLLLTLKVPHPVPFPPPQECDIVADVWLCLYLRW